MHNLYKHIKKVFICLCLIFVTNAVLFIFILFPRNQGKLVASFLDIGQGDAIYIRLPSGEDLLIDGGPDKTILGKLGQLMPFYDREIDLIVLTHPHADHLTGLIDVLKNYRVKKILMTGVAHTTEEYRTFLELIKSENIEVATPLRGEIFNFGEISFEVLNPKDSIMGKRIIDTSLGDSGGLNDTSLVLRVVYKDNELLFTGDITEEVEKELLGSGFSLESDILKVGHHGSKYSSDPEFVKAVSPKYAVIQSGKENRYGHPAYKTLRTLDKVGAKIFRNDLGGDIKFVSDGKNFKISLEK